MRFLLLAMMCLLMLSSTGRAQDKKAQDDQERKKWKGNADHLKNIG